MSAMGADLEGARVLDLFAGSGALGLEALSRGLRRSFLWNGPGMPWTTLRANIELLGAEGECRVVAGDAMAFVRRLERGDSIWSWPIHPMIRVWPRSSWSSSSRKGLPGSFGLSIVHPRPCLPSPAFANGGTGTPHFRP